MQRSTLLIWEKSLNTVIPCLMFTPECKYFGILHSMYAEYSSLPKNRVSDPDSDRLDSNREKTGSGFENLIKTRSGTRKNSYPDPTKNQLRLRKKMHSE